MSKTVLITGSSRGIGAATAREFAKNGYNVIINYLNSENAAISLLKELENYKIKCIALKADVSNEEQVHYMIDSANKYFNSIDILVNNAAVSGQKLFTDISLGEWKKIFAINVYGTFNCCKAILPQMIQRHEGKIINLSSVWGMTGASCEVHYSATKAAIIGFTKALAKEVGPSNIQVNCVAPGVINTDMNANLSCNDLNALKEETPLGTIGEPIDVANTILFLASNKSNFITGQVISPNGGFVI